MLGVSSCRGARVLMYADLSVFVVLADIISKNGRERVRY